MDDLIEMLAKMDPSSPDDWKAALTAYGNALLATCERGAALRGRFSQLAASGDPDAIRAGLAEIVSDLQELVTIGERLDTQYAECREYILMALSTRKPPEG